MEGYLRKINLSLPKRAPAPLSTNYRPEIDTSPELEPQQASYYQSLIGILRWIVELGRVDITCEVSMMASCMALPREGHLKQLFHMFSYLRTNTIRKWFLIHLTPKLMSFFFRKKTGLIRSMVHALKINLLMPKNQEVMDSKSELTLIRTMLGTVSQDVQGPDSLYILIHPQYFGRRRSKPVSRPAHLGASS